MTIAQNKALVLEFIDAVNAQRWDALAELVADGFVRHSQVEGGPRVRSRDELVEFLRREAETFPDAHEQPHFLVAEGDKVAVRLRFRGTQRGALGPFPPTGRTLEADFMCIYRVEDGKLAEAWVEWDNLHALAQLGHIELERAG